MRRMRSSHARPPVRLLAVAMGIAAVLMAVAPVRADSGADDVTAAKQALSQAQAAATAAQNRVASDQAALIDAQAQLATLQAKVTTLNAEVAADQAQAAQLTAQIAQQQAELTEFLRASYEQAEGGSTVAYIVDAGNIADLMQRLSDVDHVANAGDALVTAITAEQQEAQSTLAHDVQAQGQAQAAQAQMATQAVIIADDEATASQDAAQAQTTVSQDQQQLQTATEQEEAAQAAAGSRGKVYPPVGGPTFTEDTDLTVPSGENAQTIDAFLDGTALAGLGWAYMQAEQQYHVSARYLVAHSILESAWGTSAIARDKNNLFGYGADDRNPYGDAMSFSSYSACILWIAQVVSAVYLTPGGAFYHGPTLRGMNVDYASDPNWAVKIASIAESIPLPNS